jgi:hypothetical protein
MCGFLALWDRSGRALDVAPFIRQLDRLRGPDDMALLMASTAAGAATVVAGSAQPTVTPDGRHWLVLNGEVYNYVELRSELAGLGHAFRSGLRSARGEVGRGHLAQCPGAGARGPRCRDLPRPGLILDAERTPVTDRTEAMRQWRWIDLVVWMETWQGGGAG